MTNRYITNLIWTFVEKVIHLFSVLVVGVLLARYLGPEQYGVLTYAQSYVAMFGFLVGLGLDSITVREIVKNPGKSDIIVGTAFWLKLSMSVIIIAVINLSSFGFNDDKQTQLLVVVLSLSLVYQAFYVFVNFFQAKVNIRYISILIVISNLLLIITKLFLIANESSLLGFIIIDSSVLIMLGLSYYFLYSSNNNLNIFKLLVFDLSFAKKMLMDSWPLMISSGAIVLYMRLDQIMIKEMLSLEDLGNYAVSVRISESWYFIPMIISGVLYPSIIKAKEVDLELYHLRLKQLFFTTIWIAIIFAFFLLYFSGDIITMLFGNKYSTENNVLSILAFAGIFVAMGYVNGKWMIAENYTKIELVRNVFGLVVNVILNIILIPIYGIDGAAISTLISIFFASNAVLFFYKKTRKIFYMQNMSIFDYKIIKIINRFKY